MILPGPLCYRNVEQLIGNDKIQKAGIKNVPKFSFGRAKTFRTLGSAQNVRSRSGSREASFVRSTRAANCNYITIDAHINTGAPSENLQVYHKTDEFQTPGVGDYSVAQALLNMKTKGPKACIGNSPRFKENKLNFYRANIPASYVKDATEIKKKPAKLGSIGRQKRFPSKDENVTPGVGQYDLTRYRSFVNGGATTFEIPENRFPFTQTVSRQNSMNNTHAAGFTNSYNKPMTPKIDFSQTMSLGGGPRRTSVNFMNNISRKQRTKLYDPAIENKMPAQFSPGPAQYNTASSFVDQAKNKFTIPRTKRKITLGEPETGKLPVSYASPQQQMNLLTKKGPTAVIGSYKQRFNPTKMNAVNSALWQKGIIFY